MPGPVFAGSRGGARRALQVGLAFGCLGMVIYGLAQTGAWLWVGVPVMSLWGLVGPSILDLMSRRVSESQQGQLQGANSSSRSITGLIGPAVFSTTFAWLPAWLPRGAFSARRPALAAGAAVNWLLVKAAPADESA